MSDRTIVTIQAEVCRLIAIYYSELYTFGKRFTKLNVWEKIKQVIRSACCSFRIIVIKHAILKVGTLSKNNSATYTIHANNQHHINHEGYSQLCCNVPLTRPNKK